MYKNRICRTTPKSQPQFFIRRSDIAFDERVRYVESVCQVLIESRFGACLAEPVTIDLSDRPEPAAFSDLLEEGDIAPCYEFSPLSSMRRRNGYQAVEAAYRHAKQMGLVDAAPNGTNLAANSSPNQGRGSP